MRNNIEVLFAGIDYWQRVLMFSNDIKEKQKATKLLFRLQRRLENERTN